MSKLRPLKAKMVIRKFASAGFVVVRSSGSHMIMKSETTGRICVVPYHGKRDIPRPTLHNIVTKQAGLTEDEFLKL